MQLRPLLAREGVAAAYQLMEQPLVAVLARMEARGVAVDSDLLAELSLRYVSECLSMYVPVCLRLSVSVSLSLSLTSFLSSRLGTCLSVCLCMCLCV